MINLDMTHFGVISSLQDAIETKLNAINTRDQKCDVWFIARQSATHRIDSAAHYQTYTVKYRPNNSVDVINIDQLEYAEQVRRGLTHHN